MKILINNINEIMKIIVNEIWKWNKWNEMINSNNNNNDNENENNNNNEIIMKMKMK